MVKRTWHAWALWSIGVGSAACAVEPEDIVDEVEEAAEPRESAEGGPSAARTAPEPDREYRHPARRAGLRFDADRDIGEAMTFEDGVAGVQSGLRPSTSQHLTGEALRAYLPTDKTFRSIPEPLPRMSAALEETLASTPPDAPLTLLVTLAKPQRPTVVRRLERAMAAGEVERVSQFRAARAKFQLDRAAEVAALVQDARTRIEALGGALLLDRVSSHVLVVELPAAAVRDLAEDARVTRIELATDEVDEVDQRTIKVGHQTEQYAFLGYDGGRGRAAAVVIGQIESGGADGHHPGFREGRGTESRIVARYNCKSKPCREVSWFESEVSAHATKVAGVLFGDFFDGQHPAIASEIAMDVRSSIANEASAMLYAGAHVRTFNYIAAQPDAPQIINMSNGSDDDDVACSGRDARSQAANNLFEAGTLVIKSAGNEGHADRDDCTVTSPGAALGVFTVGALADPISGRSTARKGQSSKVRGAAAADFSSRGGARGEGGGRSIVDLAAYGCLDTLYDRWGGWSEAGCGTSYAAPIVTSFAAAFIDWYKDNISDFIDDPSALYTALLLMGDGAHELRSARGSTSGFDSVYGAGRLKARLFDSASMDGPWAWSIASTCISQGEVHTVQIHGGQPLPADVDHFRAVLFYYDARHDDPQHSQLDDIDLELRTVDGTLRVGDYSVDNKARVVDPAPGGHALELRLVGSDVTSDLTECGPNAMRVYYAWMFEDEDRDDVDGPGLEIEPYGGEALP